MNRMQLLMQVSIGMAKIVPTDFFSQAAHLCLFIF